jgi:NADPH2:quinone reductase
MSFLESSTVPLCGLTAWESIFEQLVVSDNKKKNEGKSILIINGAGGVGR